MNNILNLTATLQMNWVEETNLEMYDDGKGERLLLA